jgi:hypothetical protein
MYEGMALIHESMGQKQQAIAMMEAAVACQERAIQLDSGLILPTATPTNSRTHFEQQVRRVKTFLYARAGADTQCVHMARKAMVSGIIFFVCYQEVEYEATFDRRCDSSHPRLCRSLCLCSLDWVALGCQT